MAVLVVDRLTMQAPVEWSEQVGDESGSAGAVPVAAARSPLDMDVTLQSLAATGDTASERQRIRAQYRSLLNNRQRVLQGVYLAWDDEPEHNGWYMPGRGAIEYIHGAVTSRAVRMSGSWTLMGRTRTHRRAIEVYLRDRRVATQSRDVDQRRRVFSTDFSGLTPLGLMWLPSTVTDVQLTTNAIPQLAGPRQGYGSSSMQALLSPVDLSVASFEQAEAARSLGDVVIYDRRGTITAPGPGPDPAWWEVYGPDWQTQNSWLSGSDTPVIDNSLCRVRWDSANNGGFAIDRWSGSAWVEQGKVLIERVGDTTGYLDTLVSADVVEWAPHRAVVHLVMRRAADTFSREDVYLTMQRGWTGPRFEVYPRVTNGVGIAGAGVAFFAVAATTGDSAVKVDTAAAGIIVRASGSFTPGAVGAATFNGENWLHFLRKDATAGVTLSVLQAAVAARVESNTSAYGTARNGIAVRGGLGQGYVSAHLGMHAEATDQMMQGEGMALGTGTSNTADGGASGGAAATATRTTDANPHTTQASWLTAQRGRYRVFALVKTSASTLNIYAKTTATTGATKTTTSTSYVWVDLGDIIADGSTLEIHAWATAAATVSVDRVEAFKVEERVTHVAGAKYDGARDLGQEMLYDARATATLVSR